MKLSEYSCKLLGEETKYNGDYLSFKHKYYSIIKEGKESKITWEAIDYPRHTKAINFGVSVIPLIKEENKIVIIENYRYAISKKCLEFPAGMVNQSDISSVSCVPLEQQAKAIEQIAIKSAQRELKEETGYEGVFKKFMTVPSAPDPIKVLSNVFYDPWKSLDAGVICLFEIDKSLDVNQTPNQELDECEMIKTYEVELNSLLDFICEKIYKDNTGCTAELYSFALGIHFKDLLTKNNI